MTSLLHFCSPWLCIFVCFWPLHSIPCHFSSYSFVQSAIGEAKARRRLEMRRPFCLRSIRSERSELVAVGTKIMPRGCHVAKVEGADCGGGWRMAAAAASGSNKESPRRHRRDEQNAKKLQRCEDRRSRADCGGGCWRRRRRLALKGVEPHRHRRDPRSDREGITPAPIWEKHQGIQSRRSKMGDTRRSTSAPPHACFGERSPTHLLFFFSWSVHAKCSMNCP